jgi:HPt (histidine-containing phosphotransfer) domain-containing protein
MDMPETTAATPAYSAEDPLDREYQHKNYFALGCGDVLLEVYRIYLESAPQKLAQLQSLLQQPELESVIRLAHGLKGESGSVGGKMVMAAAAAMEKAARAGNMEEARRLLPELELQLQRTITVIQQELKA